MSTREILDVPVGDLMSKAVVTVTPEMTIEELSTLMVTYPYNGFPVVNAARALLGVVTRLDLFKLYLVPYRRFFPALERAWASVSTVGAIMSPSVVALDPGEPAIKAMALMVDYRIRTIPVITDTAGGKTVVGVITRRDLAVALKS